eukprot:CAMPEP_0114226798 /NCGR_PEP_ID=MMETSP0058-20121206/1432_1 /TAXON_ID=36894 /ORGANISM="Pyramimonas parkeae, CCMP726" /LENGTH=56 /DNA_ID=CAMNT_0001337563 /DNA_START=1338 /DNA_END=1508 /DNA_ORIENTATION=+
MALPFGEMNYVEFSIFQPLHHVVRNNGVVSPDPHLLRRGWERQQFNPFRLIPLMPV